MPYVPRYTIPASQFASSEETIAGTSDNKAVTPRALNAALRDQGVIPVAVQLTHNSVYLRLDCTNQPVYGTLGTHQTIYFREDRIPHALGELAWGELAWSRLARIYGVDGGGTGRELHIDVDNDDDVPHRLYIRVGEGNAIDAYSNYANTDRYVIVRDNLQVYGGLDVGSGNNSIAPTNAYVTNLLQAKKLDIGATLNSVAPNNAYIAGVLRAAGGLNVGLAVNSVAPNNAYIQNQLMVAGGLNVSATASSVAPNNAYVKNQLTVAGGVDVGSTNHSVAPTNVYVQNQLKVAGHISLDGNESYAGDLVPTRSSVAYTAYAYVPLSTPLLCNSLPGTAIWRSGTSKIDTSVAFGAPANIKSANVQVSCVFTTQITNASLSLRPSGGSINMMKLAATGWSQQNAVAMVPMDANGDFDIVVENINTVTNLAVRIWGYCI